MRGRHIPHIRNDQHWAQNNVGFQPTLLIGEGVGKLVSKQPPSLSFQAEQTYHPEMLLQSRTYIHCIAVGCPPVLIFLELSQFSTEHPMQWETPQLHANHDRWLPSHQHR